PEHCSVHHHLPGSTGGRRGFFLSRCPSVSAHFQRARHVWPVPREDILARESVDHLSSAWSLVGNDCSICSLFAGPDHLGFHYQVAFATLSRLWLALVSGHACAGDWPHPGRVAINGGSVHVHPEHWVVRHDCLGM